MLSIDGVYNFRDVGDRPTADGRRMRPGRVYRSATLDTITEAGVAALVGLGVRTVLDFRSEHEIEQFGRFPHEGTGIEWLHVSAGVGPPRADDDSMAEIMASDDPMSLILPMFVSRSGAMLSQALHLVAEAERQPMVIHCTSGKDRTGLVAALIQLIAGVGLDDVVADFERSTEVYDQILALMDERYPHTVDWPRERTERLAAADGAWLLGALETAGGLGSLDRWLDGIGVDAAVRDRLRATLTEP